MNHIFSKGDFFQVPDGTLVQTIIGPQDIYNAGFSPLTEVNLAYGKIHAKTTSLIHLHPCVSQITHVISGSIKITMQVPFEQSYTLELRQGQSIVTPKNTFFQLNNPFDHECIVQYIVTPAFLFQQDATGSILYNDAVTFGKIWADVDALYKKQLPTLENFSEKRTKVLQEMFASSSTTSPAR
ncbi:MAG: cupin domain-containing protein [Deltaproteobacteria bacterium]|nr:cupin domain-containing protein [Deltaproteobacteria bacterium]